MYAYKFLSKIVFNYYRNPHYNLKSQNEKFYNLNNLLD